MPVIWFTLGGITVWAWRRYTPTIWWNLFARGDDR